jgi:hypothetical protein
MKKLFLFLLMLTASPVGAQVIQGGLGGANTTQVSALTDTTATGGNKGPGTMNVSGGYYVNGTAVAGGLATPITVSNGGRQCGSAGLFSALPVSPPVNTECGVTDATACVAGTAVTTGGGGSYCDVWWNGAAWVPGGGVTSASTGGVSSVSGSGNIASSGGTTPNITFTGILPKANGGNATATPALTAGANVTITGTWPNYTIAASGSGSGISGVTATLPLSSSGGTTPNITANTHGNGAFLQLFTGTSVANHVPIFDASGNLIDSGVGPGGSTTPGGTPGQIQFNNSGAFGGLTLVPIANGGTGTASPSIIAGTNVTVTGTWPNQTITAGSGAGSNYRFVDVTCNNNSGDAALLNTAASTPNQIVRPHGICDITTAMTWTNVGFEGEDSTFNCNALNPCLTATTSNNAYGSLAFNNYTASCTTTTSTTGLQINGDFVDFYRPIIHGCSNGIIGGSPNAYLVNIIAPQLYANNTGFFCGGGTNSGEGFQIHGGTIFNNGTGLYDSGCGVQVFGTHFDFNTNQLVLVEGAGGASMDLDNIYTETSGTSATPNFQVSGYNAYGEVEVFGGQFQNDTGGNSQLLASLTLTCRPGTGTPCGGTAQAPWVRFTNSRLNQISVTGLAGNPNIVMCAMTEMANGYGGFTNYVVGNIPNNGVCP